MERYSQSTQGDGDFAPLVGAGAGGGGAVEANRRRADQNNKKKMFLALLEIIMNSFSLSFWLSVFLFGDCFERSKSETMS